jgi:hypothetical protein
MWEKLWLTSQKKNFILASIGASLVLALISSFMGRDTNSRIADPVDSEASVDTVIPKGFVLVPIEVENYQSLDPIIGKFAVVDLFSPQSGEKGNPKKLASRIKLIRAPLNPSQFAVLAPEDQAPRLMSTQGRFLVVVQNRSQVGTNFVKDRPQRSRIHFEGE